MEGHCEGVPLFSGINFATEVPLYVPLFECRYCGMPKSGKSRIERNPKSGTISLSILGIVPLYGIPYSGTSLVKNTRSQ